jgi:NitT/TauT family transport system substrate-binding protein
LKGEETSSPPSKKLLEKVRVAQFSDVFWYLSLYIAQDEGFFAHQGLDVSIFSTGGDDKTFAAVLASSADFGIADPTFVAIARSRGQKGRVVASIVNGVPFFGVTFNPKVPLIINPKQLAGFSVATLPSPTTCYTMQATMFKKAHLKPDIHQGAWGTLLAQIENGRSDIALELEPNVSMAVAKGARIVYSMPEMYGDFAMTGAMVSEETAQKRPELVQRFVSAIAGAQRFAYAQPEKTLEVAIKRFPSVPRPILEKAVQSMLKNKTLPPSPILSEAAWKNACHVRVDLGDLASMEGILDSVDNTFALKAVVETTP